MIVSLRPDDSLRMCRPARISAPRSSACDRSRGVIEEEAGLRGHCRNSVVESSCMGTALNQWCGIGKNILKKIFARIAAPQRWPSGIALTPKATCVESPVPRDLTSAMGAWKIPMRQRKAGGNR